MPAKFSRLSVASPRIFRVASPNPPLPFPQVDVVDDFNLSDTAAGTIDSKWTETASFHIVSNQLANSPTPDGAKLNITPAVDMDAFVTLSTIGTNDEIHVLVRVTGTMPNPNGYSVSYSDVAKTIQINKWTTGSTSVLGSGVLTTLANGSGIGIRVVGPTITAYKRVSGVWSPVYSVTDNTYSSPGVAGITTFGISTTRLDDFGAPPVAAAYTDVATASLVLTPSSTEVVDLVDVATVSLKFTPNTVVPSYSTQVLADSPTSYWRLSETSGTLADDAVGTNDGTYINSPTLGVKGLTVDPDTAVLFARSSQQSVYVPDSASLKFTTGLTVEAIVQPATGYGIFQYENHIVDKNHYNLSIIGSQLRFEVELNDGTNYNFYSVYHPTVLADNQVYHLAGVFDKAAGTLTAYVNGIPSTPTTVPTNRNITVDTDPLRINCRYNQDVSFASHMDGVTDEVAVYDHALSSGRIAAHAASVTFGEVAIFSDASEVYLDIGPFPQLSRRYNLNETLRFSGGAVAGISGAISCVAIIKVDNSHSWRNIISSSDMTPARYNGGFVFSVTDEDGPMYDVNGGSTPVKEGILRAVIPPNRWVLVAETKSVDNTAPVMHVYDYSIGTWTHVDHEMARANPTPGVAAQLEIGGDYFGANNWMQGNICMVGVWDRVLTNQEIQSLPNKLQNWWNLGPKGLWNMAEFTVSDMTGNGANQSTGVGTVVQESGPPLFDYALDKSIKTDANEVYLKFNIGDPIIKYNVPTILGTSVVKGSALASDSMTMDIPADCTGIVVVACGYSNTAHYLSNGSMTLDGVALPAYGTGGDVTTANTMTAIWFMPTSGGTRTLAWNWGTAPNDGTVVQAIFMGGTGYVRDSDGSNGNGGYSPQFPYEVNTKLMSLVPGDIIFGIGEVYNNSGTPTSFGWFSGNTEFGRYATAYRNMTFTLGYTYTSNGLGYWAGGKDYKAIAAIQITPPVRPTADSAIVPLVLTPGTKPFPSYPVLDTFTDASAPRDVTAYNSLWTAQFIVGEQSAKTRTDGTAEGVASPAITNMYRNDTNAADVEVFATIAAKPPTGQYFELAARIQNPYPASGLNAYLLAFFNNAGTDTLELWKVVNGTFSQVATLATQEINVGDQIGMSVVGTSIKFFVNGTQVGSTTDGSVTGAGAIGARWPDQATRIDDFGGGPTVTAVAYTDAATVPLLFTATALETREISDAATTTFKFTPSVTEVAVFTDSATTSLVFTPSSTDVAAFVEQATVPVVLTPSAVEVIVAVDANTVPLALTASAVETAQLVDSTIVPLALTPSAVEIKARDLTDAATVTLVVTPSGQDTALLVDGVTANVTFAVSTADIAVFADTNTATIIFTPSATEIAQFVDANTTIVSLTPTSADILLAVDSGTELFKLTPSGTDVYTPPGVISDANTALVTFTPSSTETVAGVDANTEYLTLTAASADVLIAVETATVRVLLTVSGSDTLVPGQVITDSGTEYLKLAPSGAEVYIPPVVYTDANSVPLSFSVSSTEAYGYADTNSQYLKLIPTAVEIYVPPTILVDAATVYLKLTISGIELFIPFITPPKHELEGTCYKRYATELETLVYMAVAFKLYLAVCQGQSYEASIPYRRWWTRYDSASQG